MLISKNSKMIKDKIIILLKTITNVKTCGN